MFRTHDRSALSASVRLSAAGLAAVLVLGGCSGSGGDSDAEAAESSSSSASPSGSSSPSETATATPAPSQTPTAEAYKPASAEGPAENVPLPVMPELAKQESADGLREFAKYWYALMNYAFETGDLTPLEQVSGPECALLARANEMLSIGYENDDWVMGGAFEVFGTQSNYVMTDKKYYQVLVHVQQHAFEYRGSNGVVYESNEGLDSDSVHMLEATFTDGHWFAHDAVIIK